MEPQDKVSPSENPVSENEGIELQIRISSDTLPSEQNAPDSVTEHLQEIKSASDEIGCTPKNDKDVSSTESSNVIAESKSEAVTGESRNVPVEKEESISPFTESSNVSVNKVKSDTIPVEVGDISREKNLSQAIPTKALTDEEKLETTSNESSLTSFDDKAFSHTNMLASSDNLTQQSNDGGNALKYTEKAIQTFHSGTTGGVSQMESVRSICVGQKDTKWGNLQVDADLVDEKKETSGNGESISPDKLKTSTQDSKTAGDESVTIKNSADVQTTSLKNTNESGKVDVTEIVSEEKLINEQSIIPTETACDENITCETSGATKKSTADENVGDKHSTEISKSVGENITKENSNIAAQIAILQPKQDESAIKEQLPTAKAIVDETVSTETAGASTSETEQQSGEVEEDSERRAFFYISSSSIPGMGKEWEWPSVSSECHYQRPPRRMEIRRNTFRSRNCLGTQRCHYIILAVGVLGAILGCLTYHLQDYGIGPKVLRPIGASAAFLSFAVCAFSSVYLTYLSYYTQARSSQNYQPLNVSDPVASMLIDTVPQIYNSDPRFYFTSTAAATAQQVFRETQSADALDRRGYSWQQTEIKRPFDEPGPSGYDPDSKRFKMDSTTREEEAYEMKSMRRNSEKDRSKERNPSQASDISHYTLADQVHHSNSSGESENDEKTPLLSKK